MDILIIIFILVLLILVFWLGHRIGAFKRDKYWEMEIPNHRKDAILRSRSILGGQFSEQLAPFLPNFKHIPTECRFVGKPVDLIVFKGMDDKNISEVIFVEVKSGNSKLTSSEKNLKETIKNKRVKWEEYRIPKNLTKNDYDFD